MAPPTWLRDGSTSRRGYYRSSAMMATSLHVASYSIFISKFILMQYVYPGM
ncbi:uncharacterized protein AFUA_8G07390 [Aspergillus fumigatus Af293]|uniref:Uncharacterized protein n=2 Tax=Aspergillus fumigatus TaxID=746128 RepID=Q4WBN2_ASPFU|nr:hypothetical protein AFUA_8G07390 [Aspergillus fumigatus Af293]EAL85502.1 hypothetical protein AFUA_8G07390 [Aspergillus fumigatus Af293]EDP48600.1 hypothetical protein AFUB_080350 [Aspergillus fumigatus A1163]